MNNSIPILLALGACVEGPVTMRGTVYSSSEATDGLARAEVVVLDAAGDKYSKAQAKQDGTFVVDAPYASDIVAEIRAEGFEPVAFPGVTGTDDVFRVGPGSLYGVTSDEHQAWRDLFAGCPGAADAGGAVFGELRVRELTEPGTDIHPLVKTGSVTVEMENGGLVKACYLDDDGALYDPDREQTGASGRFGLFGLPAGFGLMTVTYAYTPETSVVEETIVYVPKAGISPWFPAWASLPF
ncbi:MAG: hypothetical protein ACI8PZ_004515 [Myxococcota bacterium]|jgi:hypothetical protein